MSTLQQKDQSAMQLNSVPAFLIIDVEPDAYRLSGNEVPTWEGFDAMVLFVEQLRAGIFR